MAHDPNKTKVQIQPNLPKSLGQVNYPTYQRKTYTIIPENWNKLFSYYFTVVIANEDGSTSLEGGKHPDFDEFILPINPSNLSISLPFAVNVTPTTRGVFEEHNGLVFRNISISGTTGVTPTTTRQNVPANPKSKGQFYLERISPNLGNIINNTENTFKTIKGIATDNLATLANATPDANKWAFGHAQLHQLANYFVAYTEFKKQAVKNASKDKDAARARLVFVSEKDNAAYVVTPVLFEYNKSSENPLLFSYKITLRAWDLADFGGRFNLHYRNPLAQYIKGRDTDYVTRTVETLKEARATIARYSNSIKGVVSDFENVFTMLNEALLVAKEGAGLGRTLADFPEMAKDKWSNLSKDLENKLSLVSDETAFNSNSQVNKNLSLSVESLKSSLSVPYTSDVMNPSSIPINSNSLEQQYTNQIKFDIENPFNSLSSSIAHIDFLDKYPLESLSITSSESEKIYSKLQGLSFYNITDYDTIRRKIEETRDAYADSKSLGDEDYNNASKRVDTVRAPQTPSQEDYLIIKSFNDYISAIDGFSATNDDIRKYIPDPFIRAQKIVGDSELVIKKANSAFPVPFPHNGTLEGLANMYLDDPDRWIEIAILNDLKPPYIDEDGFVRFFTTAGNGNSFTIADVSNLYLNQEIFLSSFTKRSERRLIVDIKELSNNNYLVTVNGDDNLNEFKTIHEAQMKAYLPGTVNSSKIIYIPSSDIVNNDSHPDTREIPATVNLSKQQELMGVDLALTDEYDLSFNNNNDINLSVGFANALQAVKLKLVTERGEILRHADYGSGISIGTRMDEPAQKIKKAIEEAILDDPRFDSIQGLTVTVEGSSVEINVIVKTTNGSGLIPIKFKL